MTQQIHPTNLLRGTRALVEASVEHGSVAIERIQKEVAKRTVSWVERIAPIAPATTVVLAVHDAAVGSTHTAIRGVNRLVGVACEKAIDAWESYESAQGTAPEEQ